jgi:hypothetical protein
VARITHEDGQARGDLSPKDFATYMVGDGKGLDGGLPEMFMRDYEVPRDSAVGWLKRDRTTHDAEQPGKIALLQAYCTHLLRKELPGEPLHYRVVVSFRPEDSAYLDLSEFTRELMERVEHDVSQRLVWVGSAHHNTDNDHVHIGIRGLDTQWRAFHMRPAYMNRGFRWRANALLDEVLPSKTVRL